MSAIMPVSSATSLYTSSSIRSTADWAGASLGQNGKDGQVRSAGSTGGDQVEISPAAREQQRQAVEQEEQAQQAGQTGESSQTGEELSENEQREVKHLKQRDSEVRAHEQAHIMAGGHLVRGGASYSYTIGPDGKRYITGGEVSIDASPVEDDPRATIKKAQQVRKAALAPADPSTQDRAVAAEATNMEIQASMELAREQLTSVAGDEEQG